MAIVKYIGSKIGGMPVQFPIGIKNKTGFKEVKFANPFLEVTEEEAALLVQLNAHCQCFEIAKEEKAPSRAKKE